MGTSKKEMMVNNQKIACITYITTILKTHPRKVCIKLVVSPIIQYFTGLGKCPILEILNITFKYLLDIILLYIRNSWVTLPKYSMVLVYLPTFTLKTPSCPAPWIIWVNPKVMVALKKRKNFDPRNAPKSGSQVSLTNATEVTS
jgi:hypothetical protein